MAFVYQKTRAEAVCSLEQDVLVLLNDKSRMKGDLHVRFREKFEVKVLLLTRLRGRRLITASYSIRENILSSHLCRRLLLGVGITITVNNKIQDISHQAAAENIYNRVLF